MKMLNSILFSWEKLKAISKSPLGKLSFLVPFLPFFIDFLEVASDGFGVADKYVTTNYLKEFVDDNQASVMTMYLGLGFFVISKLAYEFTAPRIFREFENHESINKRKTQLLENLDSITKCNVRGYPK